MDTGKICKRCDHWKLYEEFYKHKKTKDGHRSNCKECANKSNKEYREKNKEKVQRMRRERYLAKKESALEYKKEYYKKNRDEIIAKQKEYLKQKQGKNSQQPLEKRRSKSPWMSKDHWLISQRNKETTSVEKNRNQSR